MKIHKKLIIVTAVVLVVGGISAGALAMRPDKPKTETKTNLVSPENNQQSKVVEQTVPQQTTSEIQGQSAEEQTPPAEQKVAPTATVVQTFDKAQGTGVLTVTVDRGTVTPEFLSASVNQANLGAKRIDDSPITFIYQSATGEPFSTVQITITDTSGESYTSTHNL